MGKLGTALGALTVMLTGGAFAYTAEQADRGQRVFDDQCATCHGRNGHGATVPDSFRAYAGMKAPPVAGKGALPNMQTAENVFTFVKQHMPLHKPGSLSDQNVLDIVAFELKANDMAKPSTEALTVQALSAIKLHAK
jgi:cytochrome c